MKLKNTKGIIIRSRIGSGFAFYIGFSASLNTDKRCY